jgi:hypothetical protein
MIGILTIELLGNMHSLPGGPVKTIREIEYVNISSDRMNYLR